MVGAKIATMQRGDNQHTAIAATSQGEAARALSVSVESIQRASKVRDDGAPELAVAVQAGKVSVSAAADVAELPSVGGSSERGRHVVCAVRSADLPAVDIDSE